MYQAYKDGKPYGSPITWSNLITMRCTLQGISWRKVYKVCG